MSDDNARERMKEVVRHALDTARCSGDPDQLEQYAQDVVEALVQRAADHSGFEGWLIMTGAVRGVEIADRFDTASWEITTDEHPGDRESWYA